MVGAVEGCTVVVEEIERPQGANAQHWTKFLLVEGSRASVSLPNGKHTVALHAGQGIFQREGASTLSPPFDFDVKALTENATIFTGFHRTWPGLDDINAVIEKQSRALRDGRMVHASFYWTGRGTQQGTLPAAIRRTRSFPGCKRRRTMIRDRGTACCFTSSRTSLGPTNRHRVQSSEGG